MNLDPHTQHVRNVAAGSSLAVSIVVFALKLLAWKQSGSSALLSDALESIVNIVAALFALFAIRFANKPADRDHPYGHGKIEYLSAAFEGGLVGFAAITIVYTAVHALIVGTELQNLDRGLALAGLATVLNLLLGMALVRIGRRHQSPTLVADGQHVLSDVWVTVGAVIGVVLVRLTGVRAFDPLAALLVALLLLRTGWKLVVESADGLLDREDPALLVRLVDAFNACDLPGIGGVHRLRAIRSGNIVHVDAHVYVPEEWTVGHAHEVARELEQRVKDRSGITGEIALHLDTWPAEGAPPRTVTLEQATAAGHSGHTH